MSDDESSFVILGSTPTPSMELYNGHERSLTKENDSITSNVMQSSGQTIKNYSLVNSSSPSLSAAHTDNNLNGDSLVNSANLLSLSTMKRSTASRTDFAEKFLLGEIKADSLKYNIWKHFPSFCTAQSNAEDIEKLESFVNEHVKLKENLQKTNEAMRQHFSTINKWQTRVKELKETQAGEISDCNEVIAELREQMRLKVLENENLHIALLERDEFNQKLKMEMTKIKEEHEEKTIQFNMNLAYAAGENKDLVQEISAKNAVIQNMTNMIENLEKQLVSFEMVSIQRDGQGDRGQSETSPMNKSESSSMNKSESSSMNKLESSSTNKLESSPMNKSESSPMNKSESSPMNHSQSSPMNKSQSSSMNKSESSPMNNSQSSSMGKSQISSMNESQSSSDFAVQLSAAREQNIQLLEDVSDKIVTIKRLESESSKLQHQLMSLEMIANENGQNANEDSETIRKLKDELNQMSIENTQIRKVQKEYIDEIDLLKDNLAFAREGNLQNDAMRRDLDIQYHFVNELSDKIVEMEAELADLRRANMQLRSKEINANIQAHQKEQESTEIKEEIEFLKAQLSVYKSDFELERQSRQDIANEREELLSDLKLLQRRNQQLIEEAQSRTRLSNGGASSSSTPSAPSKCPTQEPAPAGRFICPVCNNPSPSLMALQTHVQNCLEN